jgi:hypothetical protein
VTNNSEDWRWSAGNWSVDERRPDGGPYTTKDEARKAAQSYYDDAKRTSRKVRCNGGRIVAVTLSSLSEKTEVFLDP